MSKLSSKQFFLSNLREKKHTKMVDPDILFLIPLFPLSNGKIYHVRGI